MEKLQFQHFQTIFSAEKDLVVLFTHTVVLSCICAFSYGVIPWQWEVQEVLLKSCFLE